MSKLKMWFEQWMLVSFAILVGIVIEGVAYRLIDGDPLSGFVLNWYQLLSVVLTGMVCGIPTVLLIDDDSPVKIPFVWRLMIHAAFLFIVVTVIGKIFDWYVSLSGFIMLTVIYVLVYAFVWFAALWLHKQEDSKINKALDEIRDKD